MRESSRYPQAMSPRQPVSKSLPQSMHLSLVEYGQHQRSPNLVAGWREVQTVFHEELGAWLAVWTEHRVGHVHEVKPRVLCYKVCNESIGFSLLVEKLPTLDTRFDRKKNDARLRKRGANDGDERFCVVQDLLRRLAGSKVVV